MFCSAWYDTYVAVIVVYYCVYVQTMLDEYVIDYHTQLIERQDL